MSTLYITANSPGEISGFLVPLVAAARKRFPEWRIGVVLLPCTFATGTEEEVAAALPGVDHVVPTRQLWSVLRGGPPQPPAALFHLGGDLMYAALLAWRWRVPTWAYQWAQKKWNRFLRGYCVKTERDAERLVKGGIERSHIHVVGDLIVDAVRTTLNGHATTAPAHERHVVFMPGSRDHEVRGLVPWYLGIADAIRQRQPATRFSILISPYLASDQRDALVQSQPDPQFGGLRGQLREDGTLDAGSVQASVVTDNPLATMAAADVVVSIPGTKTGEAAVLGKPMVVLLPFNRMDLIPQVGLLGLLDWLPGGSQLKATILWKMAPYFKSLVAQPNIIAAREVVPELAGVLTVEQVAERVLTLLDEGPLAAAMRQQLLDLYQPFEGAADRVMDVLATGLQHV